MSRSNVSALPEGDAPPSDGRRATPSLRLLRDRRQDLLALAARHGASNVRLFGSLSRGEQRPTSDIDLLVDLDDGCTLLDLAAFREGARELLGVPVDVATRDMLKDRARNKVMADAIPL